MPRDTDGFVPEPEDNSEQDDAGQAQDVARDARTLGTDLSEESVRGGRSDRTSLIPDDVPDLVEKMNEMQRSGRIDNDAYYGEPMMDDEDGWLGDTEGDDDE
ncbi:MAG: hypothetical protein DI547_09605 [Sphingobium sp.]|nr:MAG: hypothetical protein DI547_09605 [Sphingobium sp.]